MRYDYSKLSGRITEKMGTRGAFAKGLGITQQALSKKLNNHNQWKQGEIEAAISLLEIPREDVHLYFFKPGE